MKTLPIIFSYLIFCANSASAQTPWLRFDAREQDALRQSLALPPLGSLQFVDTWLDASETRALAVQPLSASRPQLMRSPDAAFLRFDGKDDFLSVTGPRRLVPELTVVILAAPKGNAGNFSALFSTAEGGKNDYSSGLNLDQGSNGSTSFSVFNVETAGGHGFRNLLARGKEQLFGEFHVFTVRTKPGKNGTEFFLNGEKSGSRDRLESNLGLDAIGIGSRRYSHQADQPPYAQGFFHGDLAELRVYDRALTDAEREAVERELMEKRGPLQAMIEAATRGHRLKMVADAPPVQMLAPGFEVFELPLKIGNLNNVRYRADGKVVALGYDGRIHLLSDTDGDGLEDHAAPYWAEKTMRAPLGLVVTEAASRHGKGVFAASKGKVSFFPDRDGNDVADEEILAATGWTETFHGVDTLGLALDPKDESLYFGLGCANYSNGYLIDPATGRAGYDIKSERGTIQRISPDLKQREVICTGVRFTCALAFNREGDLFATEQEGATWMPNGNPLDELLHIQRGRHYGFPPRHPRHLPEVVDAPPVIEYGPQHQSTVGMVFNESVNGGPVFGPEHWAGNALVCGESRGKLWRTQLVKTAHGYVGQNHLIACLGLLLVDACVTPQGDLLLACHSGGPDWGTGPAGEGRLFKVRYRHREIPQPVAAWAAAADEFRIAFDRELDPAQWADLRRTCRIEAGPYVSAGDRYESVRPGYQVVRDQMSAPRRWIEVLGVALGADRRDLILRVPRQTAPEGYAITLPLPEAWRTTGGIPQKPEMDVAVTLQGVDAGGVILPHPSLAVTRELMRGSSAHAVLPDAAALRGWIDASNPFNPAVQPGSKLDWDPSKDPFVTEPFAIRRENGDVLPTDASAGPRRSFQLAGADALYLSRGDLTSPLNPQRFFVPWMEEIQPNAQMAKVRTDVKGDWLAGKRLFFGEATCAVCHTIRGEGMPVGPDLTNLVHRDRDSVTADLREPSLALNPDHTASVIRMKDGNQLSGIVHQAVGEKLGLTLPGGARLELARADVAGIEPMKISLMPEGLWQRLSAAQQENLLTFLLTNPLEPALITRTNPPAPPARSREELAAYLPPLPSEAARASWKPLRLLLCAGEKDHGTDEHDYPVWLDRWSRLLALGENVRVTTAMGFPTAAQLEGADVAVFYSRNPGWDLKAAALLDTFQKRGGGLVYLHYALAGGKEPMPLAERVGLAFAASAFRHGPMDLVFADSAHPITKGFSKVSFLDESYWKMQGDPKRLSVLATSLEDQAPQPQLWTLEHQGGRVFGCIPGHYTWTFDDPLYRLLVFRGICWAARDADPDRLSELCTVGAAIRP